MTVAPGTAAVAAAVAFWRSVPVSSVSLGPWVIVAGFPGGPADIPGGPVGIVGAAPLAGAVVEPPAGPVVVDDPDAGAVVVDVVAADAMPAVPRPAPATTAPVTSARRILLGLVDMVCSSFSVAPRLSRSISTVTGRS